jgi:16S rRNA (guanine(966)-N(2))-methyltransferase RsmD
METRPTPDRLRESLFNVLAPEIEDTIFLDAYAGTGAVGIEALSRGAARAVFIESNRAAAQIIRENLGGLGLLRRAEVVSGRVLQYLRHRHADIVFLDPPYVMEKEYAEALTMLGEAPPPLAIVQHDVRRVLKDVYGNLRRTRTLKHGDNCLSFYRP